MLFLAWWWNRCQTKIVSKYVLFLKKRGNIWLLRSIPKKYLFYIWLFSLEQSLSECSYNYKLRTLPMNYKINGKVVLITLNLMEAISDQRAAILELVIRISYFHSGVKIKNESTYLMQRSQAESRPRGLPPPSLFSPLRSQVTLISHWLREIIFINSTFNR